jgi:hypothetical protein
MPTTTQDLIRDKLIYAIDDALNDSKNFLPEFLAGVFSDFTAEQQADFFNALANIIKGWPKDSDQQWAWMSKYLTMDAKRILVNLHKYRNHYIKD